MLPVHLAIKLLVLLVAVHSAHAHRDIHAQPPRQPAYGIVELPFPGSETTRAFAIKDAGMIVGHADDAAGRRHAVLWTDHDATDLRTLDGEEAAAQAVSNSGHIVGGSTTAPGHELLGHGTHAFLWQDGLLTDLGSLGGDWSWAYDINDAGLVIGASTTAGGETRAVLWEDGQIVDLGTTREVAAIAYGVNNQGWIVGSMPVPGQVVPGSGDSFLWAEGAATNLANLVPAGTGWELGGASDINNVAQIVGWGRINGVTRAFLMMRKPPNNPDAADMNRAIAVSWSCPPAAQG